MKKLSILFLVAFSIAALFSCQKAVEEIAPVQENNPNLVTLTCAFPGMSPMDGTKVSFSPAEGTTQWEDGDKLLIFGLTASEAVVHTLAPAEITNPQKAVFTEDLSGITPSTWGKYPYNVAYPYDPENIPFTASTGDDSGRARFHNTNQHLMAGYIDGSTITLYNLNAAILFKVGGDYDSYNFIGYNGSEIVGYSDYLCQMNNSSPIYRKKYLQSNGTAGPLTTISGTVNGDGSTYNYIYLPVNNSVAEGDDATAVSLPNGFTIQLKKSGVIKKYITSTNGVTMSPGHYIDLGLLPDGYLHDYEAISAAEKASATELSNPKSANCYIVNGSDASNSDKVFKFPAVQGNTYVYGGASGTSVGSVLSAEVLWETRNTTGAISTGSVIQVVDFKDGFVYFKMPTELHAGNALIAVKDSGENILWSWHIWVPNGVPSVSTFGVMAAAMMDRNLGALNKATDAASLVDGLSIGLLYQWGRKDPFPGLASTESSTPISLTNAVTLNSAKTNFTIEETIQNPTVYVKTGGDSNKTWMTDEEKGNAYWGASKTIYDPCPPGYKVASRDNFNTPTITVNTDYKWFKFGVDYDGDHPETTGYAVFPIGGYLDQGEYKYRGTRNYIWTSYASSGDNNIAYQIAIDSGSGSIVQQRMSRGGNVRCLAE